MNLFIYMELVGRPVTRWAIYYTKIYKLCNEKFIYLDGGGGAARHSLGYLLHQNLQVVQCKLILTQLFPRLSGVNV